MKRKTLILLVCSHMLWFIPLGIILNRKASKKFAPVAILSDTLPTFNDPIVGAMDAPNEMIIFTNYTCEFCKDFYRNSYPGLVKDYVETGKLKIVFKDYPSRMNRDGLMAAELSEYALQKGKFKEAMPVLYNTLTYDSGYVSHFCRTLRFDETEVRNVLDSAHMRSEVEKDLLLGEKYYIKGTPTFVVNNRIIPGYAGNGGFEKTIQKLIK